MSIQRESDRTKATTKAEGKVQITKEEEKSIQDVMDKFGQQMKNLAEHIELFSKKMPSAEDLKRKRSSFSKGK